MAGGQPIEVPPTPAATRPSEPDYFSQAGSSTNASNLPSAEMAPHPWAQMFGPSALPTTAAMPPAEDLQPLKPSIRPMGIPPVAYNRASTLPNISSPSEGSVHSKFKPIDPPVLLQLLEGKAPVGYLTPKHVLIVDIRPPTAYARAHLRTSINLSAPTTLLRRSDFSIQRLETEVVEEGSVRDTFCQWHLYKHGEAAKSSWIVVLDVDSNKTTANARSTTGGGGASLLGLLRKFEQDGYEGSLCWLRGGFQAMSRCVAAQPWVEKGAHIPSLATTSAPATRRTLGLSMDAFSRSTVSYLHQGVNNQSFAMNPFFDNIRQNLELSCGITDVVPLPMDLRDEDMKRLPRFLRTLAKMDDKTRANHLAEHFFSVEKSEQQRLQQIMQRHSAESVLGKFKPASPSVTTSLSRRAAYPYLSEEKDVSQESFPLSISAALERGTHHRYRNFWTYEHGRVKLLRPPHDDSYINASYINPLRFVGMHRVYIATQAPLPNTFSAFWSVVWENKIQTIIMAALEYESGRQKCDVYWENGSAGPFFVTLEKEETLNQKELQAGSCEEKVVICRTLALRDTREPDEPTRTVTQYQFLTWPDHGVPDTPAEILGLIRHTHTTQPTRTHDDIPPTLVHCSAGIGRTGTYIMVDALCAFYSYIRSLRDHAVKTSATLDPQDALALTCWESEEDLIFDAVMVMREQRMSMIETVRQYVFVYKAVVAALLETDSVP